MCFFSNKDEAALADTFGARFVDALAGDVCRTQALYPRGAGRRGRPRAELACAACAQTMRSGAVHGGPSVRDLLAAQYGKTTGMQAMRDYCETAYRALAEYVLDAEEPPADGTRRADRCGWKNCCLA